MQRDMAVIANDHFYDAKTKSEQGVTAMRSLNLAFTEMLMHSGTVHSLWRTFIYGGGVDSYKQSFLLFIPAAAEL